MKEKACITGDVFPPLAPGKLRLYSMRFCPFSQRARLLLSYKGVPYETVNISLMEKPEWLLERNPNGTVPVMEKDDVVIYDSLIVADYLNTVYPDPAGSPSLKPADPYRQARDAMLIAHYGTKYIPNVHKIIFSDGKDTEAADILMSAVQKMEKELTTRNSKFFGGENPAMADFMMWPWMERLPVLTHYNSDVKLTSFPKVAKWREMMLTQPAVQECQRDVDMHVKYYEMWKAKDRTTFDVGLV